MESIAPEILQSLPRDWYEEDEGLYESDELNELALDEDPDSDREPSNPIFSTGFLSLPSVSLGCQADMPDAPGVYFVRDDREILFYIGRSKSLRNRWKNHEKLPDFERIRGRGAAIWIHWIESDDHKKLEIDAITRFRPLMNYQFKQRASFPRANFHLEVGGKDYQELAKAYEGLSTLNKKHEELAERQQEQLRKMQAEISSLVLRLAKAGEELVNLNERHLHLQILLSNLLIDKQLMEYRQSINSPLI